MNTIDYTNQVMTVNSVSENTTGSNAITASAINSSLLTDGKVDVSKLMLEIQKLRARWCVYCRITNSNSCRRAIRSNWPFLRARIKPLMKKAAATAALVGGAISSVLGILGSFAAINSATKGASDIAQKPPLHLLRLLMRLLILRLKR